MPSAFTRSAGLARRPNRSPATAHRNVNASIMPEPRHAPGIARPTGRSPQLVAIRDHTRVAQHIDQHGALYEMLVLLVLEQDQRAVLPGGDIAGHLPAIRDELLDGY